MVACLAEKKHTFTEVLKEYIIKRGRLRECFLRLNRVVEGMRRGEFLTL